MYSDLHHENYQRLHDAARLAASELRRQAIRDVGTGTVQAALRLLRAIRPPATPQLPREA